MAAALPVLATDEPQLLRRGMSSAEYFAGEETLIPHNLIDGELYRMPSPRMLHQRVVGLLFRRFTILSDKVGGEVILSPMDCEFADGTVLQPDLLYVVSEHMGIVRDIVHGAPDIVVEVLSPGTRRFQRERKLAVYQRHTVREAWVVDPVTRTVTVHEGANGAWASVTSVAFGEKIPSKIVDIGDGGLGEL